MRDRATHPRYGDQTACKFCGTDIEYHGARRRRNDGTVLAGTMTGGWSDRGSDDQCPTFAGYDQNGAPIERRRRLHKPVSDRTGS